MNFPLTDELRAEYVRLFDGCQLRPERLKDVDALAAAMVRNRPRYEAVGAPLSIPWLFIASVHAMESSQRFDRHLHNGDPLTARTVHVPAGRPLGGAAPFTWEESAADALKLQCLDQVKDWGLGGLLYQIERYNGFGYRRKNVPTPYLWSGSNQYSKGKYVADGKFDPEALSKQIGAAAALRRIADRNIASLPA